jgi:hypothetical protein
MPDPKTDPAPTTDPPKPTPPPAGDPSKADPPKTGDDALGEPGKAALVAERTARAEAEKANKALAAQLKVFEDASKTDAEKASEELAAARKAATDSATDAQTAKGLLTRYEVAVEKQVPPHLVEFITGSTRDDVEASVAKVLAAFGSSKPTGPRPDPSQGAGGQPVGMGEQIAAAEKAGNTREVIRLKARAGLQNP